MVARRLMIVMLVMLVIAGLSSLFLPNEPGERDSSKTNSATSEPPKRPRDRPAREGRLVTTTLEASVPRPQTIRLHVGDQLALRVEARRAGQVELGGFGQLEDIDPPAPARFNLIMDRQGTFPVRLLASDRTIGKIVVTEAAKGKRR